MEVGERQHGGSSVSMHVVSTHHISIGGSLQILWRTTNRKVAVMQMRDSRDGDPTVDPHMRASNNALMTTAFAVMKHWLETFRPRESSEKLNVYLAAAWRQGLEAMGFKPEWGQRRVTLTANMLLRSEAMKRLKEERR